MCGSLPSPYSPPGEKKTKKKKLWCSSRSSSDVVIRVFRVKAHHWGGEEGRASTTPLLSPLRRSSLSFLLSRCSLLPHTKGCGCMCVRGGVAAKGRGRQFAVLIGDVLVRDIPAADVHPPTLPFPFFLCSFDSCLTC